MTNIDEYLSWLAQQPRQIIITTHHNADADAIGSSIALLRYLQKKGHNALVILPNELPNYLKWIAKQEEYLFFSPETEELCNDYFQKSELIFCVDFSTYSRLNQLENYLKNSPSKVFLIDHHLFPNVKHHFSHWNPDAPASAELIYEFIENLGDILLIDKSIAEGIYAGLLTDTASFKHATTPKTHEIVAKFITLGLDTSTIHEKIYANNTLNKLRFTGFALQHKLNLVEDLKLAYFDISLQNIHDFDINWGDTEGLVDYALSLEGVDIGVVMIEKEDHTKFSFRSANHVVVDVLARQFFNGGGHAHAAGGKLYMNLENAKKYFLEKMKETETIHCISTHKN